MTFYFLFNMLFLFSLLIGSEKNVNAQPYEESSYGSSTRGTIAQFPLPGNPLNDRAKGFLLKGEIKNAVTNYGNFITWDEHPAGLWGEYSYLPNVSMIAGVPGNKYSCGVCVDDDPDNPKLIEWYQVSTSDIASLPSNYSDSPDGWDVQ